MKKLQELGRRFSLLIFLSVIGVACFAAGSYETAEQHGRFTTVSCQNVNHGHADVYRDNKNMREIACFDAPNGNRACVAIGR